MMVAIPMDAMKRVYHHNPCSAAMFALYELSGDRHNLHYTHTDTKLNPWEKAAGQMVRNPKMKACECDTALSQDPYHISEHYALLEVIGKCDYLIVDQYCLNTLYAMRNVGIKIHKVSPFVKTAQQAIEHFVIGAEITTDLRSLHPA